MRFIRLSSKRRIWSKSPRIVRNEVRKEGERKLAFQMSFCRTTHISIFFHGRIQVLNVFYQGIKTSQSLFMCVYIVQFSILKTQNQEIIRSVLCPQDSHEKGFYLEVTYFATFKNMVSWCNQISKNIEKKTFSTQ